MSEFKILVNVPQSGWVLENMAPWRSGRIEMSKVADTTVTIDHPHKKGWVINIHLKKDHRGNVEIAGAYTYKMDENEDGYTEQVGTEYILSPKYKIVLVE